MRKLKQLLNYKISFKIVIFFFFVFLILYGALLKHHYKGGQRFKTFQKIASFFSDIPSITKNIIINKTVYASNQPPIIEKNIEKKKLYFPYPGKRQSLLILPRYNWDTLRSQVDVVDLTNFKTIHTYKHDINLMHSKVKNFNELKRFGIDVRSDDGPIRFEYRHPIILDDGSLISHSDYSPLFKIGLCSNLMFLNDDLVFHHSLMKDHENNIWVGGIIPEDIKTNYLPKDFKHKNFKDDAIVKINSDGKILYKKSVTEILIENKIYNSFRDIYKNEDPIHLNDIEPVLTNGKYWKKGDLFLSVRHLHAILHYRPKTNKLINFITGPFNDQHDVDIISPTEISIFNNNNFYLDSTYSEVVVYNLETKKFSKKFDNHLKKENFKTRNQGLSHILNDGSLFVEEQNHGRLLLFDSNGNKEIEYINKSNNGKVGYISWSRLIENNDFIKKFKLLIKEKKCQK